MTVPSVKSTGTTTLTGGSTTDTIATITDAGIYQMVFDSINLANGDVVEWWAEREVLSAGTKRVIEGTFVTYRDAQTDFVKVSIPIASPYGFVYKLRQTAGTGRSILWHVEQLDA